MKLLRRTALSLLTIVLFSSTAFAFNDTANHWSKDYIKKLSDKEIVTGYSDGSYRPDKTISREEAATIVSRMLGDKKSNTQNIFNDVANDRWSAKYIAYLYDNGIISGYKDGNFRPDDKITRGEYSRIIYAVLDSKGELYELKGDFTDIRNNWASEYIKYLAGNKIINGFSGNVFRPEDSITRGEVAAITDRVMTFRANPLKFIKGEEPIHDDYEIPFDPKISDSVLKFN